MLSHAFFVPEIKSIITGRFNDNTKILKNRDAVTNDCYYPTFDEILAKRGYKSEYYGKFHAPEHMARVYSNPPVEGMTGTDPIIHWEPLYKVPEKAGLKKLSQSVVHGLLDLPAEYTITAVQGEQTLEALDRLKDKQFVLTSSFHCPHVPITPSEPYASMYKASEMPTPVSINDKRENSPYSPGKIFEPYDDKEKVQYMVANYNAFVTEIDDWVG
ncbi:MAG: sulfatase-like hydrolase/transferase, partial [Nitrospinales bacterium]